MKKTKRCLLGVAGLLSGSLLMSATTVSAELMKYTNMGFAMDTVISETIYSEGEDVSYDILDILTDLDFHTLSWTKGDTEIGKINVGNGDFVETSEEVAGWLAQILEISEKSDGALDPTMGEIISLWDIDGGNTHAPEQEKIEEALQRVGYQKVTLDGTKVKLEEGTTLNLGAEGKGIGCNRILDYLKTQKEVSGALINLGASSVMTYGMKPDGTPWRVAITDPRDKEGDYLGVVELGADEFLSTSGDYEKFFIEDDVRYHHIMDPATGAPSRSGMMAVTVICKDGLVADALSTACFVLGEEKALELAELYDADVLLVNEAFQVRANEGMKARFDLRKENYEMKE